MALDKITSDSITPGAVNTTALPDGAITSAKLHTTAISDKLGYTPVSPTTLNASLSTKANTSSLGTLSSISPSGTANSTKFLRGDYSWQAPTLSSLSDLTISSPASGSVISYVPTVTATGGTFSSSEWSSSEWGKSDTTVVVNSASTQLAAQLVLLTTGSTITITLSSNSSTRVLTLTGAPYVSYGTTYVIPVTIASDTGSTEGISSIVIPSGSITTYDWKNTSTLNIYSEADSTKKHDFSIATSSESKFTIDVAQGMGQTNINAGAYIKSDGTGYKYVSTRGASRITLGDGELYLYTSNSNSGTAGADITFAAKSTFQNTTGTLYNGYISTAPTAFARFNGNTGTILNSAGDYGSITRLATGNYKFTFSRAMANANYMWYINTDTNGSRTANHVGPASGITGYYFVYNTNYLQFTLADYGGLGRTDAEIVWVAIWEVI